MSAAEVQELAAKRKGTLQLLRQACLGNVFFLNTVLLSKDGANGSGLEQQKFAKTAADYLILGLSVAQILDLSTGYEYAKALDLLLSEYEAHTAINISKPERTRLFRLSKSSRSKHTPDLNRSFLYLKSTPVPFEVDIEEVVIALCTILSDAYEKMATSVITSSSAVELFYKADLVIHSAVITPLIMEYETHALEATTVEFRQLEMATA
ncbi:uncharacterized protein V1518DRAFT_412532 [Limtongia smithiae]|uniref:uncharacterized protein n=1 Tax=Limtongia smithiae TaxID=1125753 RepID=UPI0034CE02A9